MIIRYDSTAALRQAYIDAYGPARGSRGDSFSGDSWYNGESLAQTLEYADRGNTKLVPSAEKLLTQLDMTIETPQQVWNPSPVGPMCDIGDYLAGVPDCMRTIEYEMDDTNPITILATTTSSAGVDSETLEKRGTVILALVMALTRVRPVSLHQLCFVHGHHEGETVITSQINTAPLDLATACYVLTSSGFARRLTYRLAERLNGFNGSWPVKYRYGHPQPYLNYLKERLAPDPSRCLIIGAAEYGDELLQEPVAWVAKQVRRFTHQEEMI